MAAQYTFRPLHLRLWNANHQSLWIAMGPYSTRQQPEVRHTWQPAEPPAAVNRMDTGPWTLYPSPATTFLPATPALPHHLGHSPRPGVL